MNDLISRQAAISHVDDVPYIKDHPNEGLLWKAWIESLPSAQQWTPCSERLPEKSGRYLVTNTRLGAFEVTWNIFYNGKGEAPEGWLYEDGTIAWMPLPPSFKEE